MYAPRDPQHFLKPADPRGLRTYGRGAEVALLVGPSVGVVEVNGYTIEPGANLRKANLSRANLNRTVADRNTRWPVGFDPKIAGVIFD